ncbi:MAG: NYN domain-containing protein [Chloroflexi bacterium]|nr:MAG: NYN domain-containing protein [Chloroflexota bacterium]
MPNRSVVYIDGFNFYYGAVKGTPWKWLDLQAYWERIRQDDDIRQIYYFTSQVREPSRLARQRDYLAALGTLAKVRVVEGRFRRVTLDCPIACAAVGSRRFHTHEEKQTDVAIGVQMIDDAYRDVSDRLVVVSGDADLVPAVKMVRTRFPEKQVLVYVPANDPMAEGMSQERGAATELRRAATRDYTIQPGQFAACQLPETVRTPRGPISRPAEWSN